MTDKRVPNILQKINRINGIHSYFEKLEFVFTYIPENALIFMGDNWYIMFQDRSIIHSCVLDFDTKAKKEYEITKRVLSVYQSIPSETVLKGIQTTNTPDKLVKESQLQYFNEKNYS